MKKVSAPYCDLLARGLLDATEVRQAVLVQALAAARAGVGTSVPPEVLSGSLGVDEAEIVRLVAQLRSVGFAVEGSAVAGYRLTHPFDDLLVPEAVLPLLLEHLDYQRPSAVGLPYRYHACCQSTNRTLKNDAAASPAGTVVATDDQTEGRGRLGRSWGSSPGEDLAFSVLLRPSLSPAEAPLLSLAAALATAEVLEKMLGLQGRVWVKWPNDVLIDEKKVCGILLESSLGGELLEWVVAGIGVNVNSDPAAMLEGLSPAAQEQWRGRPQPTSLRVETGQQVPRGSLLVSLLDQLALRWAGVAAPDLLAGLRARDALLGRRLEVYAGPPDGALVVTGEGMGLGPQGELLVRDQDGRTVPVFAGEVTVSVDRSAGRRLDCPAHH